MNFDEIYKKLITGEISCEDASEEMQSTSIQRYIYYLINKDIADSDIISFEEHEIQDMYMIINICQFIYNNSGCSTGLTDYEYDRMYELMHDNGGADVISVPVLPNSKNVTTHQFPKLRGTLAKVHCLTRDEVSRNKSRKYLDDWISQKEEEYFKSTGNHINLNNEEIYVFPKFDGVSAVFEMDSDGLPEHVLLRGFTDKNEANDVIHVFGRFTPRDYHEYNGKYGLKTEIMMTESNLKEFNMKYGTDYKNTRSVVSAILNSLNPEREKTKYLTIVPLRAGNLDGDQQIATEAFQEYPYLRCRLKDRDAIRKFANSNAYINGELRCDGAVIYIIDEEIQKVLGRKDHKNQWEVAYKFTEEVAFTKIKDITFNVGRTGMLTAVALLEPIKMKGNRISSVSLGSYARFKDLKLRKGDKVKILYDIIPYLSFDDECKHSSKPIIQPPVYCPDCGETLVETESALRCPNKSCACRKKKTIVNYLSKMRIKGMSSGAIDKLYEYGFVKTIPDLYKLEKNGNDICNIPNVDDILFNNWVTSINGRRLVYDYEMLGSLGLPGVSISKAKAICELYNMDDILDIIKSEEWRPLTRITGIAEKTAKEVLKSLIDNQKLIRKLLKELYIKDYREGDKPDIRYSVYFTKVRNQSLEKFIQENYGKIDDSFKKSTTFLVVSDLPVTSEKTINAGKWGTPIIPIDKVKDFIQYYLDVYKEDSKKAWYAQQAYQHVTK